MDYWISVGVMTFWMIWLSIGTLGSAIHEEWLVAVLYLIAALGCAAMLGGLLL